MTDASELALSREIRDNQRGALPRLRKHMALPMHSLDRVDRINDRVEAIEGRAADGARLVLWVAAPLLALLPVPLPGPRLRCLLA